MNKKARLKDLIKKNKLSFTGLMILNLISIVILSYTRGGVGFLYTIMICDSGAIACEYLVPPMMAIPLVLWIVPIISWVNFTEGNVATSTKLSTFGIAYPIIVIAATTLIIGL